MLTLTASITGSPAGNDVEAATLAVNSHNTVHASDDGFTPLGTSPLSTLARSYEAVLSSHLASAHASYGQQAADRSLEVSAKHLWRNATDAQRAAAIAALGG